MIEIWKPVVGYESYYEVSSHGRVKSLSRRVVCGENRYRTVKEKILKNSPGKGNYLFISINAQPIGCKTEAVHRLVARAFLGDRPSDEYEVNHIDGNKANNRVDNLEWVTPEENRQHAVDMGLVPQGEACGNSKLTAEEVVKIRILVNSGTPRKHVAERYDVSKPTIDAIMQGRVWVHTLPDDYVPPVASIVGERNPSSKLTEAEVTAIRKEYDKGGISQRALSEKYGVTQTCVGEIVRRRAWSHV
jgi:hypothetical protein